MTSPATERRAAFWAGAYVFCLFASYYVLRPIREMLGTIVGSRDLPWMWLGTLGATLVLQPPFSALVARVPRARFVPIAYRFLAANLAIFAALFARLGERDVVLARVFYVWTAVYVLFAVSVFWGFMADAFTSGQGKRWFGRIAAAGTLGAMAGSLVTRDLANRAGLPILLLAALVVLEGAVQASRRLELASPAASLRARPADAAGPAALAGLAQVARSPYLLGVAAVVLLYTCTSAFAYFAQNDV
ncbi:MAG TPA: MFS transporter, partial [Planctomycetota bacterium]|nr:MFS transporter [Planctomycetota bacterium]